MPTTLGELIQESNRYSGGNIPSQQFKPKATIIEDVMEDPRYNGGGAIGEPIMMKKGIPMNYQRNNFSNLDASLLANEQRNISLDTAVRNTIQPMGEMVRKPLYAGEAPAMQQYTSKAVPMNRIKEKYRGMESGQVCIDTINHIRSCPMCSRYYNGDAKIYQVIIFMLIILFMTILYFVTKDDHKLR